MVTCSTLLILLELLFLNSVSYAKGEKVGFINLMRLVNESKMGQDARKEISKLRKKKEAIVTLKLKKVKALKSLINKKGSKMKPALKREKIEALKKAYKEYQRLVADSKEDILREDRQLVAIILKKANGILKRVAKKNKYTIILKDGKNIGYLDPRVDITNDVLKQLNKQR